MFDLRTQAYRLVYLTSIGKYYVFNNWMERNVYLPHEPH